MVAACRIWKRLGDAGGAAGGCCESRKRFGGGGVGWERGKSFVGGRSGSGLELEERGFVRAGSRPRAVVGRKGGRGREWATGVYVFKSIKN